MNIEFLTAILWFSSYIFSVISVIILIQSYLKFKIKLNEMTYTNDDNDDIEYEPFVYKYNEENDDNDDDNENIELQNELDTLTKLVKKEEANENN